jgi:hypothetical protein
MTVAAFLTTGSDARERAWLEATWFAERTGLLELKPDSRLFQFEYADAVGKNYGGLETWLSVPESFEVTLPFVRKRFLGGAYAAHVGDDLETALGLQDWVNDSESYQYATGLERCDPPVPELDAFGGMRFVLGETLNFYNYREPGYETQIDVLMPIKRYEKSEEAPVEIPGSVEKCGYKTSIFKKNKFTVMGFSKIMTPETGGGFEREIMADGSFDLLNKYRKPGAPVFGYTSIDMDSQMRGGWRYSLCLLESDITDIRAFMEHNLFVHRIDASRWLEFEHKAGDSFNHHHVCMKLGYTWNGVISGTLQLYPDGKIGEPGTVYRWYPVK